MTLTSRSLRSLGARVGNHIQALFAALPLSAVPTRGIIERLRNAGAVTPHRAQFFHPSSRVEEQAFLHLLTLGVIREPAPGRYYLDEDSLDAVRRRGLSLL